MCLKKCIKKYKWNKQKRGWNITNKDLGENFLDEHNSVEQAELEILHGHKIITTPSLEHQLLPVYNTEYGSARPDNDCILQANNIEHKDNKLIIHTKKERAIGKGYKGEVITREFTSGMVKSAEPYEIKEGMRIMAKIRMPINAVGAFTAFWFLTDRLGCYREIDVYERTCKEMCDNTLLFTTHTGKSSTIDRKMYNRTQIVRCQGIEKLYDVSFNEGWITTSINNTPIFLTQHGYPVGKKMQIIFNDAVRFWKGDNQFMEDVERCLPRTMEISNLTIMQEK